MNKARIVLGGVVAALINFFLDGALHGVLLQPYWLEIAAALHLKGDPEGAQFRYYILYDLLKGLLSTLVYALIRPRLAPGLRTALVAGLIVWALVLPVPILGLLPQGFFGNRFAILWSLYGAAPVLLGAVAGAALYKE
ncbi:MAG TPA: hypothetical protein VH083_25540 [Myxococcales bacterium]|nr:hypothetical protein [Myxococcales bacterium]